MGLYARHGIGEKNIDNTYTYAFGYLQVVEFPVEVEEPGEEQGIVVEQSLFDSKRDSGDTLQVMSRQVNNWAVI